MAGTRFLDSAPETPRFTLPTTDAHSRHGVTTSIRGWRGWRLDNVGGSPMLRSLTRNDLWNSPIFHSDEPPSLTGGGRLAGIHAFRSPLPLQSLRSSGAVVVGEVTLAGHAVVHEMGFRAEHARIDRLFLRACGFHRNPFYTGPEPSLLMQYLMECSNPRGSYCACAELRRDEWLSYGELEQLAERLGHRYQCPVTLDLERAQRVSCACGREWARRNSTMRGTP